MKYMEKQKRFYLVELQDIQIETLRSSSIKKILKTNYQAI